MIRIRKMCIEDAVSVAGISSSCLQEAWSERDFCDSLIKDYALLLVAENEGQIVGYAVLYVAADQAELESIAVLSEMRQCGIAGELLGFSLNAAYDRGVRSVTLEVRESNIAALKLYDKFHFEILGRRKHFYQNPQEDALILGSNLP